VKRGSLITFEGGEGAGKTTLIEKVHAELVRRGKAVIKTRAPGGTPVGEAIRDLLLNKHHFSVGKRCELLLFLADRAQHVEEIISPALNLSKIVLCDRYNDSTLAYQGGARGFDESLVRTLCSFACHDIQPTLTLYLDLDPRLGFERQKKQGMTADRIESEAHAFHTRIREAFHTIAKQEPRRFFLIDASKSPEEVFRQAMAHIDAII
jgi:dTMP kinase